MGTAEGERAGSPGSWPADYRLSGTVHPHLDLGVKGGRGERDAARPWPGVSETGDVSGLG